MRDWLQRCCRLMDLLSSIRLMPRGPLACLQGRVVSCLCLGCSLMASATGVLLAARCYVITSRCYVSVVSHVFTRLHGCYAVMRQRNGYLEVDQTLGLQCRMYGCGEMNTFGFGGKWIVHSVVTERRLRAQVEEARCTSVVIAFCRLFC